MPKLGAKTRRSIKESSRDYVPIKPKQKRSKSKGTSQQQLSAAQLFERAQQAIAFERYDAALECLKDALELEPENLEIIDARGALLAELGREVEAIQVGALLPA
jgi:kinesin family protein 5